jgi:malate synthase
MLKVAPLLQKFIDAEVLPELAIDAHRFWNGTQEIFQRFTPENRALLKRRVALQTQLDQWHQSQRGQIFDTQRYAEFLLGIGYLVAEPAPLKITTAQVDREISQQAGPQLVVPALNSRFVLNAANARWGSLYNALYGTDALGTPPPVAQGYDATHGAAVIAYANAFLDRAVPLASGSWNEFRGSTLTLADPKQLIATGPDILLLRHHGLHIEIVLQNDRIKDVRLESALSTIVDLEDSIAAVDVADKVAAYRNWLGLMRGDLRATFTKGSQTLTRELATDRHYTQLDGSPLVLPGRSLLLVRNVGHLMTTPAIHFTDGTEVPEGILDGIVTSLIALYDRRGLSRVRNSHTGSIYIVKPKMHGPEEAAFTQRLFDAIEDLLELPRYTIKVGVMDEERRTSLNLAACIAAVKERIVFVNTGFLDRTGDEIHSTMQLGPVVQKSAMRDSAWLKAYEARNVQIGLSCGLSGKAQIGKGMWAAPDRMADMLQQKIVHPQAGANTAWVPSPTAATLHALHYHEVDVWAQQREMTQQNLPPLSQLLIPALLPQTQRLSKAEITHELENNTQGILGYVVRWVDQGIGCSKVPDINDVGLMEDRATLRISAQHLANWLLHGVCSAEEVEAALLRMALKVDAQNASDPLYQPLVTQPAENLAFQAARALIFQGVSQPNGYTEPLLHTFRSRAKQLAR